MLYTCWSIFELEMTYLAFTEHTSEMRLDRVQGDGGGRVLIVIIKQGTLTCSKLK